MSQTARVQTQVRPGDCCLVNLPGSSRLVFTRDVFVVLSGSANSSAPDSTARSRARPSLARGNGSALSTLVMCVCSTAEPADWPRCRLTVSGSERKRLQAHLARTWGEYSRHKHGGLFEAHHQLILGCHFLCPPCERARASLTVGMTRTTKDNGATSLGPTRIASRFLPSPPGGFLRDSHLRLSATPDFRMSDFFDHAILVESIL
jgi:hypothetical protein